VRVWVNPTPLRSARNAWAFPCGVAGELVSENGPRPMERGLRSTLYRRTHDFAMADLIWRYIPPPSPYRPGLALRYSSMICARQGNRALDMLFTCVHVLNMTTMIQIRNVPDTLHRRLKSRAALAGMSLSDYLLGEIRAVAERPTLGELQARLESRSKMTPSVAPAQMVRAERDRQ
jgi:antitoxin FitA